MGGLRGGRQVLNAVAYVHSRRILHTDLKPENILLLPGGRAAGAAGAQLVKLIDFGTAIYEDAWHPPIVVLAPPTSRAYAIGI